MAKATVTIPEGYDDRVPSGSKAVIDIPRNSSEEFIGKAVDDYISARYGPKKNPGNSLTVQKMPETYRGMRIVPPVESESPMSRFGSGVVSGIRGLESVIPGHAAGEQPPIVGKSYSEKVANVGKWNSEHNSESALTDLPIIGDMDRLQRGDIAGELGSLSPALIGGAFAASPKPEAAVKGFARGAMEAEPSASRWGMGGLLGALYDIAQGHSGYKGAIAGAAGENALERGVAGVKEGYKQANSVPWLRPGLNPPEQVNADFAPQAPYSTVFNREGIGPGPDRVHAPGFQGMGDTYYPPGTAPEPVQRANFPPPELGVGRQQAQLPGPGVGIQGSEPIITPQANQLQLPAPPIRTPYTPPDYFQSRYGVPSAQSLPVASPASSVPPITPEVQSQIKPVQAPTKVAPASEVMQRVNKALEPEQDPNLFLKANEGVVSSLPERGTSENVHSKEATIPPNKSAAVPESQTQGNEKPQISHEELYKIADSLGVVPTPLARALMKAGYDVQPSKYGNWGVDRIGKKGVSINIDKMNAALDELGKLKKE